ncbi:hypothetical protein WR25_05812 [Diploscapter pachys]|uniref:Uncharacterized protein n=1 Tax=Diploscapter pachys TaxID=2018661 RepID=A0A2A2JQ20_9BILA|nr:hypothetical protein WR25_05812 [Diploscapter pachys]
MEDAPLSIISKSQISPNPDPIPMPRTRKNLSHLKTCSASKWAESSSNSASGFSRSVSLPPPRPPPPSCSVIPFSTSASSSTTPHFSFGLNPSSSPNLVEQGLARSANRELDERPAGFLNLTEQCARKMFLCCCWPIHKCVRALSILDIFVIAFFTWKCFNTAMSTWHGEL